MSEEQGTIEKMLIPKPFKVFDSHGHAGLEKVGIMDRPGCIDFWCGNTVVSRSMMGARAFMGDPNPTKVINTPEECPEMTPEVFLQYMDMNNVEGMCLQAIHGITDPCPGYPEGWKWYVPNEYVKKTFMDPYPDRFTAAGGVHARYGTEAAVEMVISAKENGFPGCKFHTPTSGYPNQKEMYPAYEKMVELGLHLQVHTGVEELPGTRAKYQHPIYLDDVGMDFPDLKILQLHCGVFNNPMIGLWNVMKFENMFTDVTIPHPTLMHFKYYWDMDHMRFLEFFMPNKVFYGTDFPLTLPAYSAMILNIMNMPLSMEFKHNLMGNNFRKFIGWKSAE
ncbi:MAG: amidohydrolase family protein [Deltaproteobacteria bacterium]|nr:amidohydrolase family protein [Deltaproteobacteria bacterium]